VVTVVNVSMDETRFNDMAAVFGYSSIIREDERLKRQANGPEPQLGPLDELRQRSSGRHESGYGRGANMVEGQELGTTLDDAAAKKGRKVLPTVCTNGCREGAR
jgi:hypothetical protein